MSGQADAARAGLDATHLGCTVYFWGHKEQDRLLAECIGPLARQLADDDLCCRFWFLRGDIRGPHILAIFTASAAVTGELRARVAAAVEEYLDRCPSPIELAEDVLAARHVASRGRTISAVDREPGVATNNSFYLSEHGPADYPFSLTQGMSAGDELWRFVARLGEWAIARLAAGQGGATVPAIRWLSRFERALIAGGVSPRDYWHYHAGTLCMGLDDRIYPGEPSANDILARLGNNNLQIFRRLWQEAPDEVDPGPDPRRLVELVLADAGESMDRRFRLVREVLHVLLNQLGLPVSAEIPAILFAWLRPDDLAAPGGAGP